jgi:hypothetical protein
MEKLTLMFTATEQYLANTLASYMGCQLSSFPVTYLGLPLSDKRLAKTDYLPLIHKIADRAPDSSANNLSMTSKVVIVNVVLSSLPIYFMSAFILPKWVIREIDVIRRNFLWKGSDTNSKKLYLANWDLICRPKSKWGLGIINLEMMNIALIKKWYWK